MVHTQKVHSKKIVPQSWGEYYTKISGQQSTLLLYNFIHVHLLFFVGKNKTIKILILNFLFQRLGSFKYGIVLNLNHQKYLIGQ